MVMVCVSHIKHHFSDSTPELEFLITVATRVATPTFLLLSGFVVSHLLRMDSAGKTRISLIDRALFLLLVAHALIALDALPEVGFLDWYFGRSLVTDAVAVALLAAVLLRNRSAMFLATLGTALCLASWALAMMIDLPQSAAGRLASAVLFDMQGARNPMIDAPLLPYVGVFFVGMALHLKVQARLTEAKDAEIAARMFVAGSSAILVAVAGVIAWHFAKDYIAESIANPDVVDRLRATVNPLTKRPPAPFYLLFYGGAGLLLLAACFARWPPTLMDRLIGYTSVIGRASLMCYVVQDWIFHLFPRGRMRPMRSAIDCAKLLRAETRRQQAETRPLLRTRRRMTSR